MYSKNIIAILVALTFVFSPAIAQDLTFVLSDVAEFKIDGDSNLRKWEADATDIKATLILTDVEELTLENFTTESFSSFDITIAVAGIDTDTGRLTSNLRNYLKGDEFPHVTFRLNQIHEIEHQNEKAVIKAEGTITAAGVENTVNLTVDTYLNNNGTLRFTGTQDMLMTDFDIDPPTALLGTVRAADEIQIIFDVTLARQ